jgi:hypothetical protein
MDPWPDLSSAPEFWTEAITSVKAIQPHFLFLAEAYWDLEPRLQSLGFDYTYDKGLYDRLVAQRAHEVQRHLLDSPPDFIRRCAHFLENHDEPRIASRLTLEQHRAAALLILGLPGMRFLHEGQLTGAVRKVSVHLGRRPLAPPDQPSMALYESLLAALRSSAVGRGQAQLIPPTAAWPDNPTAQNFVIIQWQATPPNFDLVVVNLAPHRGQCCARLTAEALARHHWRLKDALGDERHERAGLDLKQGGLYLDLPAHGAQLFHLQPTG